MPSWVAGSVSGWLPLPQAKAALVRSFTARYGFVGAAGLEQLVAARLAAEAMAE